mmetsp:Transcript_3951/g.6705  ORF Transcript_3951/g.6705 Transcript_3951/m.6705 type:complete len:180 (-) Transcript_3951:254-793(-)
MKMVNGHDQLGGGMVKNLSQIERERVQIVSKLKNSHKSLDVRVVTCTIGRKPTQAKYFISDQIQIGDVIDQINQVTKKCRDNQGGGFGKTMKALRSGPNQKRLNSVANMNGNLFRFGRLIEKNCQPDNHTKAHLQNQPSKRQTLTGMGVAVPANLIGDGSSSVLLDNESNVFSMQKKQK